MPAFPKTEDLTKARQQAVQQARTPLFAVLGAGDLANQAVVDAVTKVRNQINGRVEAARKELPTDFDSLKQKTDPAELRKKLDDYGQSARKFYDYLAKHGEETFQKLQDSPQAKKVTEGVETAQAKVEETVGEVRELADDVLGKVTGPFTKSEQAEETEDEATAETEGETAEESKPAAAKATATKPAAAKSTATKPAAAKSTTTAKKTTTAGKAES